MQNCLVDDILQHKKKLARSGSLHHGLQDELTAGGSTPDSAQFILVRLFFCSNGWLVSGVDEAGA